MGVNGRGIVAAAADRKVVLLDAGSLEGHSAETSLSDDVQLGAAA
jgi:hypothetical protein